MKVVRVGTGKPIIGIVTCIHGNEVIGKEIFERLSRLNPNKGTFFLLLANEEALSNNKRCISEDLNRCFPGNPKGNHEQRLAYSLKTELQHCDYVIDIHSTSADTKSFIVMTNEKARELANAIPLSKLVFMEEAIARGRSLIDNVSSGVSIEFNEDTSAKEVMKILMNVFRHFGMIEGMPRYTVKEEYSIYGVLKGQGILENFKEVKVNGEKFIPILSGEKEYKGVVCMKGKIITSKIT